MEFLVTWIVAATDIDNQRFTVSDKEVVVGFKELRARLNTLIDWWGDGIVELNVMQLEVSDGA